MQKTIMEQYQPHNSIDPSAAAPPFFSATTTTLPQPSSEIPPVVNFTPAQLPLPNQTSYDEMIVAAISALREKDGSSRQAIARYIERVYNNLPSNHSVLLTNHLKKLKNSGQITMVKHSYLLPSGSAPNLNPNPIPNPLYTTTTTPSYTFSPTPQLFTTTTTNTSESANPQFLNMASLPQQFVVPPFSTTTTEGVATSGVVSSPPPSQPKKRGRPPKAKPDLPPPAQNYTHVGPDQAQFQNYGQSNGPDQAQLQNYGQSNGLDQAQFQNYAPSNGPVGSVNVFDGPGGEVSVKRKPGRPRKEKPIEAQYTLPSEAQQVPLPPGDAPAYEAAATAQNYPNAATVVDPVTGAEVVVEGNGAVSGSEAMLVSLGLSDDPSPSKMRPRRLQKPTIVDQQQSQNGGKKRPGRPKKMNAGVAPGVYPVQVPVGTSPPLSSRGRGRPRKYAVAPNGVVNGGGVNGVQLMPKKRGRKPKNVAQTAAFAVPVSFMLPEQMNAAGGPGVMPQGTFVQAGGDGLGGMGPGQVPVGGGYNGVVYPPMKRGRGRPPRTDGGIGGGVKKARKLSGKPLGRPKKNNANSDANSEDTSFEIVYLKTKLSYLQTKIKEAVPVIKAYLNGEEANAMGALGQLEELATEDFGAALKAQNQQQPPAQHLQAEQQ